MNQNSQFGVLLLMGVIAVLFLLFLNRDNIHIPGIIPVKKPNNGGAGGIDDPDEDITQVIDEEPPKLIVEQLSMKTGKVVHRYSIQELGESGCYISRPTAKEGDILLDPICPEAASVSSCHLFIGEDEQGIYVVDNNSRLGTYVNGIDEPIKGTAVTNGLVLMLGKQPIRFVIPKPPKRRWFREAPATAEHQEESPKGPKILRRVR